jgi:hypothetical protein
MQINLAKMPWMKMRNIDFQHKRSVEYHFISKKYY